MILGRGTAQTSDEICAEYQQFILSTCPRQNPQVRQRLLAAPGIMQRRIGKSLTAWTDEEIVTLCERYSKTARYGMHAFLAFLFMRGYRRATLALLTTLSCDMTHLHAKVLIPYRTRLEQAQQELHYASTPVGSELRLWIWLLAVVGKPLEELTRADFDSFQQVYQGWYQQSGRRSSGDIDARLSRLEFCLVHWGVIPPRQVIFRHQQYVAQLRHTAIRQAILQHLAWCDVKYQPSTLHSRRAALLHFFLWLQEHKPDATHLNAVTREIALAFARYLVGKVEEGIYSLHYAHDFYRNLRLFFESVIEECIEATPDRNPFGQRDLPWRADPVVRYLSDREVHLLFEHYQRNTFSLRERVVFIVLLHTGIRAAELAALKASDIVQIQGQWKLHIHEGKGLKDRVIPLTSQCLDMLQTWQEQGWERSNDFLFTRHGRPWQGGTNVCTLVREMGLKIGLPGLTPHRFRHTFAVSLLNYGMRESALQKLMGHATLGMTLEYARILDRTVEQSFTQAVEQMQVGPLSWVPSFFQPEEYQLFAEGDTVSWIRLPHGFCRRHPKLHCESDVKCLLCDRYYAAPGDLPRLQEMYERFVRLGMSMKAEVVAAQIRRLEVDEKLSGVEIPLLLP